MKTLAIAFLLACSCISPASAGVVRFTAKHVVKPAAVTSFKITKFAVKHIVW